MFPNKEPTAYVLDAIYSAHRKSTPSLPELDPFTIKLAQLSYIADEREATVLERARLGGQGLEGENKTGRAGKRSASGTGGAGGAASAPAGAGESSGQGPQVGCYFLLRNLLVRFRD